MPINITRKKNIKKKNSLLIVLTCSTQVWYGKHLVYRKGDSQLPDQIHHNLLTKSSQHSNSNAITKQWIHPFKLLITQHCIYRIVILQHWARLRALCSLYSSLFLRYCKYIWQEIYLTIKNLYYMYRWQYFWKVFKKLP